MNTKTMLTNNGLSISAFKISTILTEVLSSYILINKEVLYAIYSCLKKRYCPSNMTTLPTETNNLGFS